MKSIDKERFHNKFNELRAVSEAALEVSLLRESVFGERGSGPESVFAAIRHSVLSPGKRVRGVIALAVSELLGVSREWVESTVSALEILHAASLIHDDLPALDNDTLRRGRPTTHVEFGEGIALLVGDLLFGVAIRGVASDPELSAPVRAELSRLLSHTFCEICIGQVEDLEQGEGRVSQNHGGREEIVLESRHRKKTGALFAASAAAPALIAGNGQKTGDFTQLSRFGSELGLLFQITDDLLDAVSTTERLGKEVHTDQRHLKLTYVSLLGIDGARKRARDQTEKTLSALEGYGDRAEFLRELVREVEGRER